MIIHFICKGNGYRSRLAEAYLSSKRIKNLKVISSGVLALKSDNGFISWYAQRIIQYEDLINYSKPSWQQTTSILLNKADINIFMDKKNYEYAKNNLSYGAGNYEVWNIPDIDDFGFIVKRETLEKEQEKIKITEETYQIIRRKIDEFISTHTIVP
ncbi:MAG: hypothetical protein A3H79_03870 [Candidatus Levybacteria bacterium RIFCSPLOWO2_02_FULL_36_8b]|nr:MAG: hypothetical protein A3H79_03870 [Candidatus Levybacteria bacterium RIFCSPLOWO2_02_FULL_36_8b]